MCYQASQECLDKILAEATNIRDEAVDLMSEAILINAQVEGSINEQQRISSDAVQKERANTSSLSQRQRDHQAAASRLVEEALQASLESERKTWQGKVAALEKKTRCCSR